MHSSATLKKMPLSVPSRVDCMACGEPHWVRRLSGGPFRGLLLFLERGLRGECTETLKRQAEAGWA